MATAIGMGTAIGTDIAIAIGTAIGTGMAPTVTGAATVIAGRRGGMAVLSRYAGSAFRQILRKRNPGLTAGVFYCVMGAKPEIILYLK